MKALLCLIVGDYLVGLLFWGPYVLSLAAANAAVWLFVSYWNKRH